MGNYQISGRVTRRDCTRQMKKDCFVVVKNVKRLFCCRQKCKKIPHSHFHSNYYHQLFDLKMEGLNCTYGMCKFRFKCTYRTYCMYQMLLVSDP